LDIRSVFDKAFLQYGQILEGYDFDQFLNEFDSMTTLPEKGFAYVASDPKLETNRLAKELQDRGFGGLPIQIGYCIGMNHMLNCLEYHRTSELCIAATDAILFVASQAELQDYTINTSLIEAFLVPRGVGVELFATTLHYAPCSARKGEGFKMVIVLPRGTNGDKPPRIPLVGEAKLLMGENKWLIAHKDAPEAKQGAFIGIKGKNLDLRGVYKHQ